MDPKLRVPFPPDPNPKTPKLKAPSGSWDTHFHIYVPHLSPYVEERRYTPPAAPIEHFLEVARTLGIERGVLVQPNVHGDRHEVTVNALKQCGGRYLGMIRADLRLKPADMDRLHEGGIRGMRFVSVNRLGESTPPDLVKRGIAQVTDHKWVIDLHIDEHTLIDLADVIATSSAPIIIDAWGRLDPTKGLDQPALKVMVDLLRTGHVWIKFASPNRFVAWGFPYASLVALSRYLVTVAPDRILWGTDWPHSDIFAAGQMPNDGDLLDALLDFAPDDTDRMKILVENPRALFEQRFG